MAPSVVTHVGYPSHSERQPMCMMRNSKAIPKRFQDDPNRANVFPVNTDLLLGMTVRFNPKH
jgi:hypothetical protein